MKLFYLLIISVLYNLELQLQVADVGLNWNFGYVICAKPK